MPDLASPRLDWPALEARMRQRGDEIDDVLGLLLDKADRTVGTERERHEVAWAIACATLGDRHLWQDLGLPSRDALSQLIAHWFPALAQANHQNMKWKKFFYRQLCLREEILICKSPTCGDCSDHSLCFGPEEAEQPETLIARGQAGA